jgi:glutamyl-tRNA reductase
MSGELLAIGASHKSAPLPLRERLALSTGIASRSLASLTGQDAVREAVALSTCNRTELHLVADDPVKAERAALALLSDRARMGTRELACSIYSLRGRDAVEHLFGVTAGLDSMIVGEAEIQGQVKRAYEHALAEGVTGPVSNRLFRDSLAAGKRVREQTEISRSSVSVSSVAVRLAGEFLGELESRRVLVIGAGRNAELTTRSLRERGVHAVVVANRRYDRALRLAKRVGGRAASFDELPTELERADIVISSTGAPHQVLGPAELLPVAGRRASRPLVLIDLAVPRDIEPRLRNCPGIALYDIDDLQRAVAGNIGAREAQVGRARELMLDEVERFERWREELDVMPTIQALRARGEQLVAEVLRDNEGRWESVSAADRERVAVMARAVAGRLLHEPTLRLKRSVGDDDANRYVSALRDLFGLEPPSPK